MIKFYNIEEEDISKIKLDELNPNEMSKIKFEALKKMVEKEGFLQPIIIDKENNIIDGEHRFKALKEMGQKKIQVIRLDVDETRKKILRQTMNKIKGMHNPREDIEELLKISKEMPMRDLSELLGIEEKNLSDYLDSVNQVPESFLRMMLMEKSKVKNVKIIYLKMTDEQAKKILDELGDSDFREIYLKPIGGMLVDNLGKP